jgi:hypothetical protein
MPVLDTPPMPHQAVGVLPAAFVACAVKAA